MREMKVRQETSELELSLYQQKLLEAVAAAETSCHRINVRSAMDSLCRDQHTNAVLSLVSGCWEGGTALADILFGKVSQAESFQLTFPIMIPMIPEFTDYS